MEYRERFKQKVFSQFFSLQISGENGNNSIANVSEEFESSSSNNDIDVDYLIEDVCEESETQGRTMSVQQYNQLMQLIPLTEKLKNTIKRMEEAIKSKDSKLKELQKNQKDTTWLDLSKLSTVSSLYQI